MNPNSRRSAYQKMAAKELQPRHLSGTRFFAAIALPEFGCPTFWANDKKHFPLVVFAARLRLTQRAQ